MVKRFLLVLLILIFGTNTALGATDTTTGQPVRTLDITSTGSITANAQSVVMNINGQASCTIQITGTWVGTFAFQGTTDGTNYVNMSTLPLGSSTTTQTTTANGIWQCNTAALKKIQIVSTAWTSGTATVTIRGSATSATVGLTTGNGTQGSGSSSPLYSTDPNIVTVNLDASKNTIVVGKETNGAINIMHSFSGTMEMNGSAAVTTSAVSIAFTNPFSEMDVRNFGAVGAYCSITGTATASLSGNFLLPPHMDSVYVIKFRTSGASTLSCITASGTTTVQGIAYG